MRRISKHERVSEDFRVLGCGGGFAGLLCFDAGRALGRNLGRRAARCALRAVWAPVCVCALLKGTPGNASSWIKSPRQRAQRVLVGARTHAHTPLCNEHAAPTRCVSLSQRRAAGGEIIRVVVDLVCHKEDKKEKTSSSGLSNTQRDRGRIPGFGFFPHTSRDMRRQRQRWAAPGAQTNGEKKGRNGARKGAQKGTTGA